MKPSLGSLALVQPQRLWSVAVAGCLLVPLLFLTVLRQTSQPLSIMNLQVSIVQSDGPALLAGDDDDGAGGDSRLRAPGRDHAELLVENATVSSDKKPTRAAAEDDRSGDEWRSEEATVLIRQVTSAQPASDDQPTSPVVEEARSSPPSDGGSGAPSSKGDDDSGSDQKPDVLKSTSAETTAPEGRIACDLTLIRTDLCELNGDVRINGSSASVVLATPSPPASPHGNNSWVIKPYARKWEANTMAHITEFSVRTAAAAAEERGGIPACTVNHAVPAVVFSTGGLQGNFFHDMADVLVPLFLTTHHYNGEVQLLITQYRPSWIEKYRALLKKLSRYDAINVDGDTRVHCFPRATVGLRSHKELGIDPAMEPSGYTMADFRAFLRSCLSLKREYPMGRDPTRKPRLLFLSRRGSRSLLNERKVIRMARNVGFKVTVAPPEAARDMSRFAHTVNSCDVMVGVHGAGLTNMVFLPTNGTLVQIVPWGELKYPCRFPYGDPAIGMGLRYLEYEVGKEESSLIRQYPRDHPVLTDPLSIHRQGFPAVWSIFIDKQNVTVDVRRFRSVLVEALSPFR